MKVLTGIPWAILALFTTTWACADPLWEELVGAEGKLMAEQVTLATEREELNEAWENLVAAVNKAQEARKNLAAWCQEEGAPSWCKTVTEESNLTVVLTPPDAPSEEYPLRSWCAKQQLTECTTFAKALDEYQGQKRKTVAAEEVRNAARRKVVTASKPAATLPDRLAAARRSRCATAYCFGGATGDRYALEPVLDLPIGLTWAIGNGVLARHVNSNGLDVRLNAGVRFWAEYDLVSIAVLLFQPSLTSPREIHYPGLEQPLGNEAIRRPYPSLAIGFVGDILLLTLSYDQLRNVRSNGGHDPNFLPNEVLSRAFTFGLYLAPITTARNGLGVATAPVKGAE